MEAECESGKGYRFHFGHSFRTSKLECGTFFFKTYDEKGMFDRPLFAKKCFDRLEVDMDPVQPLITFINSKMNRVANQLIFKILSVQKLFILVQRFKHFLNNIFELGFAHF